MVALQMNDNFFSLSEHIVERKIKNKSGDLQGQGHNKKEWPELRETLLETFEAAASSHTAEGRDLSCITSGVYFWRFALRNTDLQFSSERNHSSWTMTCSWTFLLPDSECVFHNQLVVIVEKKTKKKKKDKRRKQSVEKRTRKKKIFPQRPEDFWLFGCPAPNPAKILISVRKTMKQVWPLLNASIILQVFHVSWAHLQFDCKKNMAFMYTVSGWFFCVMSWNSTKQKKKKYDHLYRHCHCSITLIIMIYISKNIKFKPLEN